MSSGCGCQDTTDVNNNCCGTNFRQGLQNCPPKVDLDKLCNDYCDKKKNGCEEDKKKKSCCDDVYPPNLCPALLLPGWFCCPPQITVKKYPAPPDACIRPISEGRQSKDRTGCPPPKIPGTCPFATRNNCICEATGKKKNGNGSAGSPGIIGKILAFFGLGKK